jgi:hypothetical protein
MAGLWKMENGSKELRQPTWAADADGLFIIDDLFGL